MNQQDKEFLNELREKLTNFADVVLDTNVDDDIPLSPDILVEWENNFNRILEMIQSKRYELLERG